MPEQPGSSHQRVIRFHRRFRALILILLFSSGAIGGELRLRNGASIPGELKRIESAHIVWNADLIGEITVAKADVDSIASDTVLDLQSKSTMERFRGCTLSSEPTQTQLACPEALPVPAALSDLQPVIPEWESTGKITASMKRERGSSDVDEVDITGATTWRRHNRRHKLDAELEYDRKFGNRTKDKRDLEYQADFLRQNGWYRFFGLEHHRDQFSSVEKFELLSAGLGRDFALASRGTAALQAGVGEARLTLTGSGTEPAEIGTIRWQASWDSRWLHATLFHEANFKFVVDDPDVWYFDSSTGINVPLVRTLRAEFRFEYDKVGVSDSNTFDDDIEWRLALVYSW